MKKTLKIILTITALILVIGFLTLKDNSKDFVAYESYASELQSFETGNGIIKYYDEGEGQAIVLLHGTPTSSWMYRDVSAELVQNGYRVIAPDLMGFGASSTMGNLGDYDFNKQAGYIINLMDDLGIESWEMGMHDMGGLIGLHIVKQSPEKISHVHVLNTILYTETFAPPINLNEDSSFQKNILRLHTHKYLGKLIVNMMLMTGTRGYDFTSADRAGYWLPLRDGAEGLVHFFTHTAEVADNIDAYRSWLVNSGIPTSIMWGEHDSFLGVEAVRLLQNEMNIPDEHILILSEAKHLIAEEMPLEVAQFIINN